MKRFYRFIKGTEQWNELHKCFTFQDSWKENESEIEGFLGFPMQDNIYFDVNTLTIKPEALPDEWKDQFKKNSYPAQAKGNSKLNKEWRALCKRLGLEVHTVGLFSFNYGIYGGGSYHKMFEDYYFVAKREQGVLKNEFEKKWVEEISEIEFLEIRSKHLKDKEATKAS